MQPQISQNCKLFQFWSAEKKNLGLFSKNYKTFYPKNCHYALKNMGLGSGIRKKPIPGPGSRGQKGTGSRIRIRNTFRILYFCTDPATDPDPSINKEKD